jgi:hypothetical protein
VGELDRSECVDDALHLLEQQRRRATRHDDHRPVRLIDHPNGRTEAVFEQVCLGWAAGVRVDRYVDHGA